VEGMGSHRKREKLGKGGATRPVVFQVKIRGELGGGVGREHKTHGKSDNNKGSQGNSKTEPKKGGTRRSNGYLETVTGEGMQTIAHVVKGEKYSARTNAWSK